MVLDDLIDSFSVYGRNGSHSGRTEHFPHYSAVAGILKGKMITVEDVVEEGAKDCTPGQHFVGKESRVVIPLK